MQLVNKKCIMFYFLIYRLCLLKVEKRVTLTIMELEVFKMFEYGQKWLPCTLFVLIFLVKPKMHRHYSVFHIHWYTISNIRSFIIRIVSDLYIQCAVCSGQRAISKPNGISIKRIMFNVIFSFGSLIQYFTWTLRSFILFSFQLNVRHGFYYFILWKHSKTSSNVFHLWHTCSCMFACICNLLVLWPFIFSRLW